MKKPSEELVDGRYEFQDFVVNSAQLLGLSVSSLKVDGQHHIKVTARSEKATIQNTILLEAMQHSRKVGEHAIAALKKEMDGKNATEGVFISSSGFTSEAVSYATANNIRLLTHDDLQKMKAQTKTMPPSTHNTFERVFSGSMDLSKAREAFDKQRRKSFLGLIGQEEKVDSVEGRFAPVGWFRMRKNAKPTLSPNPLRIVEGENDFYINLHTCGLYYLYRGLGGRDLRLKTTNLLRRMLDMDENAVRILSDIVEQEEILIDRLDPNYRVFLQENVNTVVKLQNFGLIGARQDGKGFLSNINLPPFKDERYDLRRHMDVEDGVESNYPADPIVYGPRGINALLMDFFSAAGEFKGVIYLPYYQCRYVSSDGRMRLAVMEDIKPKNA